MSDSTGAIQDGATETVTTERFNGLMSSYQKEKARADALERQLAETRTTDQDAGAQDQTGTSGDSQQTDEWEVGDDDTDYFGPEPPTPQRHNERRDLRPRSDDTTEPTQVAPTQSGWVITGAD